MCRPPVASHVALSDLFAHEHTHTRTLLTAACCFDVFCAAAVCACSFSFQQAASTASTTTLQVSWDNFTDTQSGVTGYVVQFFQQVR
jgi:hypothetical protein